MAISPADRRLGRGDEGRSMACPVYLKRQTRRLNVSDRTDITRPMPARSWLTWLLHVALSTLPA